MRYRKLSPTGDYVFGNGQKDFWIDVPDAPAQVVETSLKLWFGEFFLNINAGVPYPEGVLGKHSQAEADLVLISYINQCQGVTNIQNYQSEIDPNTRAYKTVSGLLNTVFGPTPVQISLQGDF